MYINTEFIKNNFLEKFPIEAFIMLYNKYSGQDFVYNREYVSAFAVCGLVKITSPEGFEPLGLSDELFGESKPETLLLLAKKIRELFPVGVYSGGYPVRSSEKDILEKLRKFTKKHKYTNELILEATERYIEKKRIGGWNFIQKAVNFIEKDKSSTLAAEIDDLLESEISPTVGINTML